MIVLILIIDQVSKIYIKTHFQLGQELKVFDWFRLFFIENEGMAWGAKISDVSSHISDSSAKLFLTIFRIFAVCGIGYWLHHSFQKSASKILIIALALVFSGALGNIFDSVFYGIIFDGSLGQTATLFPSKGYSSLFRGNVVDMLYFPLFKGYFPQSGGLDSSSINGNSLKDIFGHITVIHFGVYKTIEPLLMPID